MIGTVKLDEAFDLLEAFKSDWLRFERIDNGGPTQLVIHLKVPESPENDEKCNVKLTLELISGDVDHPAYLRKLKGMVEAGLLPSDGSRE